MSSNRAPYRGRLIEIAALLCGAGLIAGLAALPAPSSRGPSPAAPSPVPAGASASSDATPPAVPSAPPASPSPTPTPTATPLTAGRRLQIPSIGVDTVIESVTTDARGAMDVPRRADEVAWYSAGPAPGSPAGDSVIDGHLDWTDGPAVFWNLAKVQTGQPIVIRWDGHTFTYRITGMRSVAYNASVPGLFENTGAPRLSLITCGGTYDHGRQTYLERLIVDASLT